MDRFGSIKMVSNSQDNAVSDNEQQGSDESDEEVEQTMETLSSYQMKSCKSQAFVTVRQLRSKGLSFQLWPAADAVCWYVEHEFGNEGMWTPHCSPLLADPVAPGDRISPILHTNFGAYAKKLSTVLDTGFARNDNDNPSPILDLRTALVDNLQEIGRHPAKDSSEAARVQTVGDVQSLVSGITEVGNCHLLSRKMRVLELGAGTGMVGIVAACLGAQVVLTDLPHVIPNISHNLELNRAVIEAAGGSAEARVLRWGVADDVKALGNIAFDIILASDCVYHVDSFKPFLETLKWVMARDSNTRSLNVTSHEKGNGHKTDPESVTNVKLALDEDNGKKMDPESVRNVKVAHDEDKSQKTDQQSFENLSNACDEKENDKKVDLQRVDNLSSASDEKENGKKILRGRGCNLNVVCGEEENGNKVGRRSPTDIICNTITALSFEQRGGGKGSKDTVIILGHLRRWKKDSHFFRMAAKFFDIEIAHRHLPQENVRVGAIVYLMTVKPNRKHSSRPSSTPSIRNGSNSSSP